MLMGFLGVFLFALNALGMTHSSPKRVLILDSFGPDVAPFNVVAAAFRTTLTREMAEPVAIHQISLETARFTEPEKDDSFVRFIEDRFDGRKIDLVVPIAFPAVDFTARQRKRLFPAAPVLMTLIEQRRLRPEFLTRNSTAVTDNVNLTGIVEDILKVLPGTRNIVVVLGTSPLERFWTAEARREFQRFSNRVSFTWFNDLSLEQMKERVAALPPHSVVLFGLLLLDGVRVPHDHDQALKSLHAVANAPMFSVFQSQFGSGIVGGRLFQDRGIGIRAAQAAIRILGGESPANIPPRFLEAASPIYDGRELERWGISEKRLPPGSIVEFRVPSMWELYKWYIIGAVAIIALQAALITALLVLRAKLKQSIAAVSESEERLRRLVETTAAIPWEADAETWAFTYVGPQAVKLLGYPLEQWYEKDFWVSHLHPEDKESAITACLSGSKSTENFEFEYRMIASSGETIWVHDVAKYEHWDGNPSRVRGFLLDITERKAAEERQARSRAFEAFVLESLPDNIAIIDTEGKILAVNEAWKRFAEANGASSIEAVSSGADYVNACLQAKVEGDADARTALDGIQAVIRGNQNAFSMEYLCSSPTAIRWFVMSVVPFQGPQGGAVISHRDITEIKRAESEAQRLREEIAHVTRVQTMGELTATVAHELNQPLGAILSNAEAAEMFLKNEPPALSEVRDILADIRKDDIRAGEIIHRMRALLRKQEIVKRPVDINKAVGEIIQLTSNDAAARKVAIKFEPMENLPPVWADRVQLQQVVMNLILNGLEAMAASPETQRRLVVRTKNGDIGAVEIAVYDSGPGIPADNLPKLFEQFYTTKKEGTGMGLSIARTIVEAHQGQIWAENSPDGGAVFRIKMPVAAEEPA